MYVSGASLAALGVSGLPSRESVGCTYRRYPLYAIVGESEDAVVRVGYETVCTRFSRDALCLDMGVGCPVQSFPLTSVEIAVHKKESRFWLQEHLGYN